MADTPKIKANLRVSDSDFSKLEARINEILTGVKDDVEFKDAVAESVFNNSIEFMPYDTGNLIKETHVENGVIQHNAVYAHRLYNGTDFNFNKAKHPLATSHWIEVGFRTHIDVIVNDINKAYAEYLKRRR